MSESQENEEYIEDEAVSGDTEEAPHIPVLRQLSIAFGILLLIFGTTYLGEVSNIFSETADGDVEIQTATPVEIHKAEIVDYFETVSINAESAYVWDVTAQRALYNKNADEQLPLASITKLMTALVAYELLESDEEINITTAAIREAGDSGFSDGESFSLRELTDLTLITSSNDGAYALAAAAGATLDTERGAADTFIDAMNIRAEEIGLSQTYFNNPTGLDMNATNAGAYGSARDIAFLMEYIITNYPNVLELTTTDLTHIDNQNGEAHFVANTNTVVNNIDGLIASKTGYTELAGGNLVVAFNAGLNRPIVVSVLGSTRNDRFIDVLELVDLARLHVDNN